MGASGAQLGLARSAHARTRRASSGEQPAEVGEGPGALVEDDTKPRTQSVAVDHKDSVEVGHLKHRSHGQGGLEGRERRGRLVVLGKCVSLQEAR
jgi:hypothetical protein